jgi:hypothetical protein
VFTITEISSPTAATAFSRNWARRGVIRVVHRKVDGLEVGLDCVSGELLGKRLRRLPVSAVGEGDGASAVRDERADDLAADAAGTAEHERVSIDAREVFRVHASSSF